MLIGLVSGASLHQMLNSFFISLTFAVCCGGPAILVLPRTAPYYATRPAPWNWVLLIGTLLGLSMLGTLAGMFILTRAEIFPSARFWQFFRICLLISVLIGLAIGISKFLYEGLKHRLELATRRLQIKELEEERARKLAIEARLSSLESRIHPHFLFNTLNSISSLIQEDPQLAERLVERLAALLRFSLDSNQAGTVPLGRELKIVIDYLEIEKARFGDKLRYSIDVPAELEAVDVPPLAVQTLVENSLKHAISRRRDGGEVRVRARAAGEQVILEVQDNGPGFHEKRVLSGHGLDNLKARLNALFADGASLDVLTRGEQTVVVISLPSKQTAAVSIV
jgi:sensor histidine kinase YesM